MMPRILFLIIVTGMLGLPNTALACSCADVDINEHFRLADSVSQVRVQSVEPVRLPRAGLRINVDLAGTPYKGNPRSITTFFTGPDSASCGIRPEPGSSWLFFVQHDPDYPGVGHVNRCNGSQVISRESRRSLISALDALREGRRSPRVEPPKPSEPEQEEETSPHRATLYGTPRQFSVIGLLELPRLLEPHRFRHERENGFTPIPVYAAPAVGAAIQAHLSPEVELPTAEFSYERPGAIVHERKPGWYRIALHRGAGAPSGWIESSAANAYWPVEKILPEALSYLTEYWDGRVWTEPGGGESRAFPERFRHPDDEQPVEVLDADYVGDSLWWKVEVHKESVCSGRGRPMVVSRGWIPAFDEDGRNTAWFHSRGC